jgi:peroxiredoxin
MQKLMAQLEQLDRDADKAAPADQAAITDKRTEILGRLADQASDDDSRNDWTKQQADVLSAAAQSGNYPKGIAALDDLIAKLAKDKSDDTVALPYVKYRRMWADYTLSQQAKDADLAKIQEKWLGDLEAFAKENPKSVDAAEALLQLGMANEFAGKSEEAQKWYQKLVENFPKTSQAATARGALTRLGSKGKPMVFRATDLKKKNIDLAAAPYRGKVVAIYYWATWCDHCKERMDSLNDIYAKWAARGFDIVGVCVDKSPDSMNQFLTTNGYKWSQVSDAGGRLSNEMGVMTLPLMMLVDQQGNVVSDNIYIEGLEPELQRLLSGNGGGANSPATAQSAAAPTGR